MSAFYDKRYDVLLSTTIVESGLDIPSANTLIVHRADSFGLAQLYQIRGRVGRAKTRAYAYMTTPANRATTETADKRLKVLSNLDSLGAGFQLASHDLDIRGAGNLLGDEQSGHIKEVGFELYQSMLEEAITEARHGGVSDAPEVMFKKAMQVPDGLVYRYFELGTALPLAEAENLVQTDVKEAHRVLARELVLTYYGDAPVKEAEERFDYVAKGGIPDDLPEVVIGPGEVQDGTVWVCKLATLAGLTASNGEARRLIQNRGLKLDGEVVTDAKLQVTLPATLQRGKDTFVRVVQ